MKRDARSGNGLGQLGEFGLIDRIAARFGHDEGTGPEGEAFLGIGDDCTVLPVGFWTGSERAGAPIDLADDRLNDRQGDLPGENAPLLLATTDLLLEGSHFRIDWTTPDDLGRKSLAVNLSDIAAMGGTPFGALLAIGLPPGLSLDWVDRFLDGVHALCREHGVELLGGDTTQSRHGVVIDFTVLGRVGADQIRLRSHARPGDVVAMTGWPGESGAGLAWLLENEPAGTSGGTAGEAAAVSPTSNLRDQAAADPELARLLRAHHNPRVFVREGAFLGRTDGVGAMLDLSDGLLSDAGHIARRSGCDVRLDAENLPISDALRTVCARKDWDPLRLALSAGEDYGLLFTLRPELADSVLDAYESAFGERPARIGRIEPCAQHATPAVRLWKNSEPWEVSWHGFDHFRS